MQFVQILQRSDEIKQKPVWVSYLSHDNQAKICIKMKNVKNICCVTLDRTVDRSLYQLTAGIYRAVIIKVVNKCYVISSMSVPYLLMSV